MPGPIAIAGVKMQNKEFKRVWEKEGRRLFAIQKQVAADSHRAVIEHRKSGANAIPGKAGAAQKVQRWHPAAPARKRVIFKDL